MNNSKKIDYEAEKYWYWLCNISGIGRKRITYLLDYFETPANIFHAHEKELQKIPYMFEADIKHIKDSRVLWNPDNIYHNTEKKGIQFISISHPDYPEKLKNIADPPYMIYIKGRLPDQEKMSIAIIGARMCSPYGRKMAEEFSQALALEGVQIISGMAAGIDGISQMSALKKNGTSFGILGCGADICYPEHNRKLYEQLIAAGGIISEFSAGTLPKPAHFPLRNRIISGLADAVLVIEAKAKSGSLITADLALEQGKDVFAVPGRLGDSLSSGCNNLIKQGAGIVISPADLMKELDIFREKKQKFLKKSNIRLAREENLVYSCLDFKPKNLHSIISETGLSIQQITTILVDLQTKGCIEENAKNYYVKI